MGLSYWSKTKATKELQKLKAVTCRRDPSSTLGLAEIVAQFSNGT